MSVSGRIRRLNSSSLVYGERSTHDRLQEYGDGRGRRLGDLGRRFACRRVLLRPFARLARQHGSSGGSWGSHGSWGFPWKLGRRFARQLGRRCGARTVRTARTAAAPATVRTVPAAVMLIAAAMARTGPRADTRVDTTGGYAPSYQGAPAGSAPVDGGMNPPAPPADGAAPLPSPTGSTAHQPRQRDAGRPRARPKPRSTSTTWPRAAPAAIAATCRAAWPTAVSTPTRCVPRSNATASCSRRRRP